MVISLSNDNELHMTKHNMFMTSLIFRNVKSYCKFFSGTEIIVNFLQLCRHIFSSLLVAESFTADFSGGCKIFSDKWSEFRDIIKIFESYKTAKQL